MEILFYSGFVGCSPATLEKRIPIKQYLYLNDDIKIHVLKFENLKSDFDSLMKIYNIDLTLDRLDNFNNKIFGVKDIDHENIKLINEYFDKDFQLFSYDKISISVASEA